MKHNHYKRDVSHLNTVDVYRIIKLFGVTCPVAQHVLKKSLAAGQRGHKDLRKDWQDILDSAERQLQMLDEDAMPGSMGIPMDMPDDFGQQHTIEPAAEIDDTRPDIVASSHGDGEHYAELDKNGKRWPEWATHRLMPASGSAIGSQYAKYHLGAYISSRGRSFKMDKWQVVEVRNSCAKTTK